MDLSYQESYAMNPKETRRKVVETYLACGSISATARQWKTSRNVVRKWVRRYQEEGIAGLEDRSHRPHRSPNRTADDLEEKVVAARQATGYGRKRLAWYLWREEGVVISPHTIRHILRRHGMTGKRKRRKTFYPAHWSWEEERPFALAQVDVKDILDKGTLGTKLWDHLRKTGLPRYQWTFLEGRTRLRFLAFSHQKTITNGLCFLGLVMLWVRGHGIEGEVIWQTDWGEEFGGSNPEKLEKLQKKFYEPLGARLARIPVGRKEYNGRVERSHRTDDEEFYLPLLGKIRTEGGLLQKAAGWVYYYNLVRPHFGAGMDGKTPFAKLRDLGIDVPEEFALFPPLILDRISADWMLEEGGNHLLAHYKGGITEHLPTGGADSASAGRVRRPLRW